MESIKKLSAIFNRKQKCQFAGLFIIEFIGSLFELLGVSMLIPFIEVVTDPSGLMEKSIVRKMMDIFQIHGERQLLLLIVGGMIVIYATKNIYLIFMTYIQYQIIWRNRLKMEIDIMSYYVRQPYVFHVQRNTAEMQRTILTDIGNVFEVLNNVFLMIAELLTATMLLILMLKTDIVTTLAVLFLLAAFLLLYFKVFKKRLYQYGKIAQYYGSEGLKCIHQVFGGIKEIKVNECEEYFINEFEEGRKIQIRMMKRGSFFQQVPKYVLEAITICGILGIVFLKLYMGTNMTQLLTQIGVFALAAYRILPSANRITAQLAYIFNNKASIDLIHHAIINDKIEFNKKNTADNINQEETVEEKMGDIMLKNVVFCYPNTDEKILDDVSVTIKGGMSTALKGPSGAGKTTTADIILGILKPVEGEVCYDGVDIEELGRAWYKHVGYIPQNIYLSDDTICKNVAFGENTPDEKKIWKALEEAQLKEFIEGLPDGLDARIGENGVRISGGQRQRIGIARALYNDPEILILDEATSALDGETERALMESIDYLKGKKTLIIIAHRLSTIENCDITYEIREGKVLKEEKL